MLSNFKWVALIAVILLLSSSVFAQQDKIDFIDFQVERIETEIFLYQVYIMDERVEFYALYNENYAILHITEDSYRMSFYFSKNEIIQIATGSYFDESTGATDVPMNDDRGYFYINKGEPIFFKVTTRDGSGKIVEGEEKLELDDIADIKDLLKIANKWYSHYITNKYTPKLD